MILFKSREASDKYLPNYSQPQSDRAKNPAFLWFEYKTPNGPVNNRISKSKRAGECCRSNTRYPGQPARIVTVEEPWSGASSAITEKEMVYILLVCRLGADWKLYFWLVAMEFAERRDRRRTLYERNAMAIFSAPPASPTYALLLRVLLLFRLVSRSVATRRAAPRRTAQRRVRLTISRVPPGIEIDAPPPRRGAEGVAAEERAGGPPRNPVVRGWIWRYESLCKDLGVVREEFSFIVHANSFIFTAEPDVCTRPPDIIVPAACNYLASAHRCACTFTRGISSALRIRTRPLSSHSPARAYRWNDISLLSDRRSETEMNFFGVSLLEVLGGRYFDGFLRVELEFNIIHV